MASVSAGGRRDVSFEVRRLGECKYSSPVPESFFADENRRILLDPVLGSDGLPVSAQSLEPAGPHRKIFFKPEETRAAIVTCGGLCPGLNDVIRAVTMVLWYRYGVRDILGIRYGYAGMAQGTVFPPVPLTPEIVEDIHQDGGTILGSSRGEQSTAEMVDFLVAHGIKMLFAIGGDGTQRAALEIEQEARRRNANLAVVGIPKTIDNDISFTDRTFGFETAVEMSRTPIRCAHMEAKGAANGIGLVKLMGRESGFVAAFAALASSDVNMVLIPEVPFSTERVLEWLEARLARKSHAVIVAAEGAGQDMVASNGKDASGNVRFGDIGLYLKDAISSHFRPPLPGVSVKYIDPSYTIRSAPANADDSVFCFQLGEKAVHAAMAGRTGLVVSHWSGHFVLIPTERAVSARKLVDPAGPLWQSVLDNTGQPARLSN
jgi:6-phosphofructokinase 1